MWALELLFFRLNVDLTITLKIRSHTSETISSSRGSAIDFDWDDADIRVVIDASLDGSELIFGKIFVPTD